MNILSLLSAMLATSIWIGGIYCYTRNRKTQLNSFSFIVLFLLGWWSFCNAFFFSAQNAEDAMRWHKIASLGWVGFIAATTYYFIVLTELNKKMKHVWIQCTFYALPVILMVYNLFSDTTSLAVSVVKSTIGGQWTLKNSVDNIWLWLYMICLCCYFGFSFYILLKWAKKVKHIMKRRMAIAFVSLDFLTISLGSITDVVIPLTSQAIPSIANLCTAIFVAGYFLIIVRYDIFNVRRIVEDREIIECGINSMAVLDERGEILDVNKSCCEMFEKSKEELRGTKIEQYFNETDYKERITVNVKNLDSLKDVEMELLLEKNDRKQVMISVSVIRDKKLEYIGTVLSMRDVTQLSELKELYQKQSEEYKKLAYYDTLTGIPNRRMAFEYFKECADRYSDIQKDFFVIYIDFDHFKTINDIYGHNIGDAFLTEASKRMKKCMNENLNFLARLGGDEFVFVANASPENETNKIIKKIKGVFVPEFVIDGIQIQSGISAGYARYSEYLDIDQMVHAADEMMYQNKKNNYEKRMQNGHI